MKSAKTALITGASEGIGRAIAIALAKDGYSVTAVARNKARLADLERELGSGHRILVADLAIAAGVKVVNDAISAAHYDLLVNNAGAGLYGEFSALPLDSELALIRLNCDAVVSLSHGYLQTAKPGDALVNVASTLAFTGFPFATVYAATKAFVLNFSESLWFEAKDRGIYVTALCPGATETKFHKVAAGGRDGKGPPKAIMESADDVAKTLLDALAVRSRPSVVSGGKNRARGFIASRVMSRKMIVSLMGRFGRDLKD